MPTSAPMDELRRREYLAALLASVLALVLLAAYLLVGASSPLRSHLGFTSPQIMARGDTLPCSRAHHGVPVRECVPDGTGGRSATRPGRHGRAQGLPYMLIVARAGRERDCRRDVRDLGFAVYQPRYREVEVKRGRKRHVEKLLFGRYFFARHPDRLSSPTERGDWRVIPNLRHVTELLMTENGTKVSLAPDKDIERVRAMERNGFVDAALAADAGFVRDQRVRAGSGAFWGFTGEYVGRGNQGCDRATIELFGRRTVIEFGPGVLQAA